jgi:hypothetical protein
MTDDSRCSFRLPSVSRKMRNWRPIAPVADRRCRPAAAYSHTGAYWMLLDLRAAFPSWNPLRQTEFADKQPVDTKTAMS